MIPIVESDARFYVVVGAATIAVFVAALVGIARIGPTGLGGVELVGLVVGFSLFMLVFFVAYVIQRVEEREDV